MAEQSGSMPTIGDLIRNELQRGKSVRDLETDSGGQVAFQTFQQLAHRPPRNFPKDPKTVRGMARALQVDEMTVVLAYAAGLGIYISGLSNFALRLPPGVDDLDPQLQDSMVGMIRAAVKSHTAMLVMINTSDKPVHNVSVTVEGDKEQAAVAPTKRRARARR